MRLITALLITLSLSFISQLTNAEDRAEIGVVAALQGVATLSFEGQMQTAAVGNKLYLGDTVITSPNAKMQIMLRDLTTLTIAADSELVVDEFIYDPGVTRNLTSKLVKGVVKLSSPRMTLKGLSSRKLALPNATVSIRGTQFLAKVDERDDIVVLFNGLISVENQKFIREIAKPNFGVSISNEGTIGEPEFIDENQLANILEAFDVSPASETSSDETADGESNEEEANEEEANEEEDSASDGQEEQDSGSDDSATDEEDSSSAENSGEASDEGASDTQETQTTTTQTATSQTATSQEAASTNVAGANVAGANDAPISSSLNALSLAPAVTTAVAPVEVSLSIEAVDAQVTQELDEVLQTVALAVVETQVEEDTGPVDSDGDGVVDDEDAFPNDASETLDTDGDGIGNNADSDDDGDGVADGADPNPLVNDTADTDGDGTLDIVDTDDDGDGVADSTDAFPLDATESVDTDGDGIGNNADSDDDGDGVADTLDPNPLTTDTLDTDGDGTLDIVDTDDDGDGVADSADAFPLDANESADTDGDGTGDNADTLDNSRLVKAPNTSISSSGWTSSSWNNIASELGSGTATFTANNQTASHSSGTNCIGCSADVDTTLTIDFSDMDYRFTAETTFTKPTYDPITFTASSPDIPLGQYSLSSGSFTSVNNHNDLQSSYDQDIAMTFTSTTDPSDQITADMSANFYYDAYQSDTSDVTNTNLGVRGYTKIIYDDANNGIDQHNTPFYPMDPQ